MKGVLTRKQRVFNYRLSRTRMTPLLDLSSVHVDMEVKKLVIIVLASCILHNICEVQNNNFLPEWEENVNRQELAVPTDDVVEEDGENIREILGYS
jgi:hypothetical protein